MGTTLALGLILAAMLFSAGLDLRYFALAGLCAVPALYWLIFHSTYRHNRILAFLNPYADPLGKGFQILQSYIAVGTGGITGVGLMEGKQKLFFLPEPQTDFIFAVVGEELGLIGTIALVAVFAVILVRGLRASAACQDDFGRLLAIGLTVMIVGQALVNMSVVLGLLAHQGHSPAVRELWRIVAFGQSGGGGNTLEYFSASELTEGGKNKAKGKVQKSKGQSEYGDAESDGSRIVLADLQFACCTLPFALLFAFALRKPWMRLTLLPSLAC